MIVHLIKKEWIEVLRSPWQLGGMFVVSAVLVILVYQSELRHRTVVQRQQELQEQARQDWLEQETQNAHQATHHGTSVYKVFSPLAALDPGVDPQNGTALRLESHQQHQMTNPLVPDPVNPLRFSLSTPALFLQAFLPLFLMLLTFSSISREREQGTLPLVLSMGISWRRFMAIKWLANGLLAIIVLLPATICWFVLQVGGPVNTGMTERELVVRSILFLLFVLVYLSGWLFLAIAISARSARSRTALLTLLSFWTVAVVIIPKIASATATQSVSLPRVYDVLREKQDAVDYGDDGEHAARKINAELEQRLLKKYGVSQLEDLPINLAGAKMLALEAYTDQVYDQSAYQLEQKYAQQQHLLEQFSWLSPFWAMRMVSMGITGTDRQHHLAFYRSAETYRRLMVKTMNEYETASAPSASIAAGPDVWALVPAFQYQFPSIGTVLQSQTITMSVLLLWLTGTSIAACRPPRNLQSRW